MDTEFVYSAVRAESLIVKMYHIHIMPSIRRLVAQAQVLTRLRHYEPCGGKVALGNSFCVYHSTQLCTHLCLNVTFIRTTNVQSLGTFKKAVLLQSVRRGTEFLSHSFVKQLMNCKFSMYFEVRYLQIQKSLNFLNRKW